jgi:large subunit ribosomal protein L13
MSTANYSGNSTYSVKAGEIDRKWYVVDADGLVLGRLASEVAMILRGKKKPTYTPHLDVGDHVVVINAERVTLTGDKINSKLYYHHTMYPGGLRVTGLRELMDKHPDRVITRAVRGMLPKTKLGRAMLKKLRVYRGKEHPHVAQNPEQLDLPAARYAG